MSTYAPPYPGTTRFRVVSMAWDDGVDGQGAATYSAGRWFVPEDEHDECCNWLRAEIRRLHRENETMRAALQGNER